MPNNEEAHRALDRVGVKKGPLPERVMEAVSIIEELRVQTRTLTAKTLGSVLPITEPTEPMTEQQRAQYLYPRHSPEAALANYRAGKEVWDTNGDQW